MGPVDSKSYQLRVRVTAEVRGLLDKLCTERQRGETVSDLVREALALLTKPGFATKKGALSPGLQARVERLAVLLKREPQQVEEACIEGILDLVERKCEVPLIVMEARLHEKYRNKDDNPEVSPTPPGDIGGSIQPFQG